MLVGALPLAAQDNLLDLRIAEIDRDGQRTYHNFIYSRTLLGGKVLLDANHLLVPQSHYRETSVGAGYRTVGSGASGIYLDLHG